MKWVTVLMAFLQVSILMNQYLRSDRSNSSTLQHTEITYENDLHKLNRLNPSKSCGPDKCHPRVLKNVKDGLIVPLYYLYNKSLQEATLPLSWKEATKTPIFKMATESSQIIIALLA